MKQVLAYLSLIGCFSSLQASTPIIDQSFANMSADQFAQAGWNTDSGRGRPVTFPTGEYMAVNNWGQNKIWTDLAPDNTINLGTQNAVYSFNFRTHSSATDEDALNLFCLSGEGFSMFFGTSYKTSPEVDFGTRNEAITWTGASWYSLGTDGTAVPKLPRGETTGTMVSNTLPLTYQLTLTTQDTGLNVLAYTVTDGTNTYGGSYSFESTAVLNQLGFLFDGENGKAGVYSVSGTKSIPEPASASLALLGCAAFFLRRKRA